LRASWLKHHLARLPVSLRIAQAMPKVIMPAKAISKTRSIGVVSQPLLPALEAPCAAIVAEMLMGRPRVKFARGELRSGVIFGA
jgi:hypothetical protein